MTRRVKQQRGAGVLEPYVAGTGIEEVKRKYGLENVIKLASNENRLDPPPRALLATERALPRLNIYPDGQSYYLRHAPRNTLGSNQSR